MSETTQTSTPASQTQPQRQRNRFDSRWLLLFVIILSVLITTTMLNNQHTDESTKDITSTLRIDDGDSNINWNRYPTTDIELTETITTIAESGTYHITGALDDGAIVISATDRDKVRLILDNVTLKHNDSPAIFCYKADDLVIELVGDNTIEDGDYSTNWDEDDIGAIYANADLTFQGNGTLNLVGNSLDGIIGKDDVKFNGGTYNITAKDDGIRAKDSLYIIDGNFNIISTADAIKVTNDTDPGKGFILIEDGNFNLTASAKGLKATKSIFINGGDFLLNTYDDAIHSNQYIGITDGVINISSGDDGIHADSKLFINGGEIAIAKAYEGLEAQVVTVNDGKISLTTTDDGINAGGGADASATNRPGANPFDADENCVLSINGGTIHIDSAGDGVDSNGWLYFNGGTTVIDGPTNNGNGALDSGMGIVMNGGEVIAIGASGMAETLGSSSSVYNISAYLDSTMPANTSIEIKDSENQTILSHTSAKTFNHITAGTSHFQLGETYTIYLNGEKYQTFTISNITTTIGKNTTNQPVPPNNNRR